MIVAVIIKIIKIIYLNIIKINYIDDFKNKSELLINMSKYPNIENKLKYFQLLYIYKIFSFMIK